MRPPRFPALQHLDVSGCRRVRGEELAGLAGMRGLRALVLSGCEDVGDEGIACLAALTRLTALNLSNCCKVGCLCEPPPQASLQQLRRLRGVPDAEGHVQCQRAPGTRSLPHAPHQKVPPGPVYF